jgi:glucuronate isomerase
MQNKPYINDDFLLTTDAAKELYHSYAEKAPLIDYHCHLPVREIAEDKRWNEISDVWLGGDHYKWRLMRSNGFAEDICTSRDTPGEVKFAAFAQTLEKAVGNPMLDWTQLELARYFGVTERLSSKTAASIRETCNKCLAEEGFSARSLMLKSNVKAVCTTDDPDDTLEWHAKLAEEFKEIKVLPTWRPDRILKAAVADGSDPMPHLAKTHEFFGKMGSVVSDYGLDAPPRGRLADLLVECMKLDAAAGRVSQLHFNCIRNPNSMMFKKLGPDTGFDCISDACSVRDLAVLLDRLEVQDAVPKTILYSLNQFDTPPYQSLAGSFQKAPFVGKIQVGSAWWFNDHMRGMEDQLEALMSLGLLGNFVGMLTDSRSFLSYPRHEYFRRILCRLLGDKLEKGEVPCDIEWLGGIVKAISFDNANSYFGLGL